MWEVEKDPDGTWVASWNGEYMPNTYQSREEAMEVLLNWISERF